MQPGSSSIPEPMLPQAQLIERLRHLCQTDEQVVAATLYGSFVTGEADAFSDIECAIFFQPAALLHLDKQQWIAQLAPLLIFFKDAFGHYTAIFTKDLIRGEFHFAPAEQLTTVSSWQGNAWFPNPAAAILVDRTGELRTALQPLVELPQRDTPETVESLMLNFANLVLFGSNTLARGELARSLEILGLCHRHLLWLARLAEGATLHWPTPARRLEQDLSAANYQRFTQCTARLEPHGLIQAYRSTWVWGAALASHLVQRHHLTLPDELFRLLDERMTHFDQ
jgi:lincosamide nucleotidyltransferase B/F